jgi:hypothetical protein
MTVLCIGVGRCFNIYPRSDVIVLPGETIPEDCDKTITFHKVETLDECLRAIRWRFFTHEQVASMGGLRVQDDHPTAAADIRAEWLPAIHRLLEMIIDDIGNCPLDSWHGARNAILQGKYLETCPNTASLHNALVGKPAICLGAGPTAQAYLSRINPETHYVFCCDAMAAGIDFVPQFTCMLERTKENLMMVEAAGDGGSRLIALPVIDRRAAYAFNGKALWWMTPDYLCSWLAPDVGRAYAGRSTGSLSIAAALLAGCNPIYLIGQDHAYGEGSVTHADVAHKLALDGHCSPHESMAEVHHMRRFMVDGNNGQQVETCGLYSLFKSDIEHILTAYPDRTVINCGGLAKIKGTVMGDLDVSPFLVHEPNYIIKPIRDRMQDIPRIIENAQKVQGICDKALAWLENGSDSSHVAKMLVVSEMVDRDLCQLFNFIFCSISNNLNLQTQYRFSKGQDAETVFRAALRSQALTMHALCEVMIGDLCI